MAKATNPLLIDIKRVAPEQASACFRTYTSVRQDGFYRVKFYGSTQTFPKLKRQLKALGWKDISFFFSPEGEYGIGQPSTTVFAQRED